MKIVCISDTHLMHLRTPINVPRGDVLVHAGDATFSGRKEEIRAFAGWFLALPHEEKIFVPGNHDWGFDLAPVEAAKLLPGVHVLHDSGVTIDGVRFWGSPYQPEFMNWAFNLPRGEPLKRHWDMIPEGTDVLITHGPPHGIGDLVPRGEKVGCEALRDAVVRVKPKLHVFGHIHCGYGVYQPGATKFVNASVCNEAYEPVNAPIECDL